MKFIFRLLVSSILVGGFFVLIQDFLIFPGLFPSKLLNRVVEAPVDVVEYRLSSGTPVWELSGDKEKIVILFHGNADSLESFYPIQKWFQTIGYGSLSVEFRGYNGWASGWPSSEAFFEDAEEAYGLTTKNVLIFGSSIGTGVATYLAAKKQVEILILSAPFYSLKRVVEETPLFGLLSSFLFHDFASYKRVSELDSTCVINIHGVNDQVISASHSRDLSKVFSGTGQYFLELVPDASHNDVLPRSLELLSKRFKDCERNLN